MPELNCADLLIDLSKYLDGDIPAEIVQEVENHLAHCQNCRAVLDTTRKTLSLFHALPKDDLPAPVKERLYKTLDLEKFFPSS